MRANRQLKPSSQTMNLKDRLSDTYIKDAIKRFYLIHANGQIEPVDVQEDSATEVTDLKLKEIRSYD